MGGEEKCNMYNKPSFQLFLILLLRRYAYRADKAAGYNEQCDDAEET